MGHPCALAFRLQQHLFCWTVLWRFCMLLAVRQSRSKSLPAGRSGVGHGRCFRRGLFIHTSCIPHWKADLGCWPGLLPQHRTAVHFRGGSCCAERYGNWRDQLRDRDRSITIQCRYQRLWRTGRYLGVQGAIRASVCFHWYVASLQTRVCANVEQPSC